jgi:hypothetical protein
MAQQPWAAQFAAAMRRRNVAVDLQNPKQVGEVRESCTEWLLRRFSDSHPGHLLMMLAALRQYLAVLPQRARRRALAQLRTGAHWLAEETGRWQRQQRQQRLCVHCSALGHQPIETVPHFIFACALVRCATSTSSFSRRPLPPLHSCSHRIASSWPALPPVHAIALT